MTPTPKRAETPPPAEDAAGTHNLLANSVDFVEPSFDQDQWLQRTAEERGSGGRQVLAGALAVLAALWLGYTAWSAGRVLAGQPLSSPQIAESRPLATMENFFAFAARSFNESSSASAAASNAGPILADVAGRLIWNASSRLMRQSSAARNRSITASTFGSSTNGARCCEFRIALSDSKGVPANKSPR